MSAAAGGKYKRSRKSASSKKKYTRVTAKAVTSKVLGIAPGRDPFAAMTPRFFKVNLEDTMIYCNAPGTVSNFDSNLAPVPWMNQGAAFADSTGAASALQFGFTIRAMLGDLYNKDEFINLFQSFAIQKMDIRITQTCGDSYGGVILPTLYSAPDDNDSTVWASQHEVNGYQGVKEHAFGVDKPFMRTCYPKPSTELFINAVTSGYAVTPGPIWVDTNSPNTPHYGMKFYIRNFINGPNSGMALRVQPTLWFACRNPH